VFVIWQNSVMEWAHYALLMKCDLRESKHVHNLSLTSILSDRTHCFPSLFQQRRSLSGSCWRLWCRRNLYRIKRWLPY
jgi:hypothetical protein